MDPNNNPSQPQRPQPLQPQPGQIANQQPLSPPRPQPDWQQGLGGIQPPQVPTGPGTGIPAQSEGSRMPGSIPPVQTAPQPGELPTPFNSVQNQPQPYQPQPLYQQRPQPQPAWAPPAAPAPAPITAPQPNMGAGMPAASTGRRGLLVTIIIVALLIIGGGIYAFMRHKSASDNTAQTTTNAASNNDLAAISQVMLMPPSTISGYTERKTGAANIKDFVANDNSCELIIGTTTAAQLPGANLADILKPQIEQLRKAGATVHGPTAGDNISVKDADNGSISYSLPTMKYDFTQGDKHAAFHYSAAILKSGDRVVINRSCVNQNGAIDEKKMTALDDKAKQIRIMKQQ